jgi:hypothetical protein
MAIDKKESISKLGSERFVFDGIANRVPDRVIADQAGQITCRS